MSHGHTHGPDGNCEGHGHGQQPQQMQLNAPDPALQAAIDADFREIPIQLGAENSTALCDKHKLEKCRNCHVDYINLNRLAKLLAGNPSLMCPPPPQVVSEGLTKAVTNTKDEGNQFFKMNQHDKAIGRYNMAASIAVQRPPWEDSKTMREELSAIVSNRSAAYHGSGDFISALADAETVIQLRKTWPKGYFRKAKALIGLKKYDEGAEALKVGLSYEPENVELNAFLVEVERVAEMKNLKLKQAKIEPATPLVSV